MFWENQMIPYMDKLQLLRSTKIDGFTVLYSEVHFLAQFHPLLVKSLTEYKGKF